jgi:kynurenine formamidase
VNLGRVVDLSQVVDSATQIYPGDPVPSLRPATTIEADGFNVLHVHLGSHTGTHVDAPYHFVAEGARIDAMPLTSFLGVGVVADVTGRAPRTRIGWADLAPYEAQLSPGRILLVRTGWSEYFGTERYYDHPFLDGDAARRVLDLGVRTVGIDALSPDETVLDGPPSDFAVHHAISEAGGVIAENLTRLADVDFDEPLVSLLPIKLGGSDGAPVRAIAMEML